MSAPKPATPLPWKHENEKYKAKLIADEYHEAAGAGLRARMVTTRRQIAMHGNVNDPRVAADFAYIAHAANNLPRLVAALKEILGYPRGTSGRIIIECGWEERHRAMLRELGEAE